jgi:hypothetical protein
MSQTTRRPRFFKPNQREYPSFAGWNATLCDDGHGMLVRLVPMSEAEMAAIPAEAKYERGIPAMICLHPAKRTVEVYPAPEREFDAVTETKGWQSG